MPFSSSRASVPLLSQLAIVLTGLASLAFSPPAHGAILLLPVGAAAANETLPSALRTDARLIGPGPVAASLIVYGDSGRLRDATRGRPILVLAAPFAACGE